MIELKFNEQIILRNNKFENFLKNKIKHQNYDYEYKTLYVYLLLGLYSYQNLMGEIDDENLDYKQKKVLQILEYSYLNKLVEKKINIETIKKNLKTNFISKHELMQFIINNL